MYILYIYIKTSVFFSFSFILAPFPCTRIDLLWRCNNEINQDHVWNLPEWWLWSTWRTRRVTPKRTEAPWSTRPRFLMSEYDEISGPFVLSVQPPWHETFMARLTWTRTWNRVVEKKKLKNRYSREIGTLY